MKNAGTKQLSPEATRRRRSPYEIDEGGGHLRAQN